MTTAVQRVIPRPYAGCPSTAACKLKVASMADAPQAVRQEQCGGVYSARSGGQFDLMGLPAGEDSVRKIKTVKPAAEIVAEMMAEAREILRAELAATSEGH